VQVLSNGPHRAVFKLAYAPWDAGAADKVSETKMFTVDCGVNFDAVESTFALPKGDAVIALGITDHPANKDYPAAVLTRDPQGRWMSLWEEDKNGGLGTAVILDHDTQAAGFAHEDPAKSPGFGNHLLLVKAHDGAPLRYFIGAGWNRSGQFADRAAWESYVKATAAAAAKPLKVSVSARP
jgi:hypothetical protein